MSQAVGVAVVTGAGQGLGRAFALALAKGAEAVVVADLDSAKAASVTAEIESSGGRALPIEVDVADEDSVAELGKRIRVELGTPTVLVNNAAMFSTLRMGSYDEIDVATWERVLRVNTTGAWLCARELVPQMAEAGYGKVINVSSATVWTGRPGYLHYVTSKAALIGLTRALAAEVGPQGVRVNAITPGSTQTEIERQTIGEAERDAMAGATALRRVQVPADVVGAVTFLASTESDFITGQTLNIDGGFAYH